MTIQTEIRLMEILKESPGIKVPGIARKMGRHAGYVEKLLNSLALDDCVICKDGRWYLSPAWGLPYVEEVKK